MVNNETNLRVSNLTEHKKPISLSQLCAVHGFSK